MDTDQSTHQELHVLDDQCARALGWKLDERGGYWWDASVCVMRHRSWSPSTNHEAARILENEIERRGQRVQEEYVIALGRQIGMRDINDWNDWEDWWKWLRATPEQKVRAFLEAIHGSWYTMGNGNWRRVCAIFCGDSARRRAR